MRGSLAMQKTSIIISCSSMDVEYTKALVDSLRRYTLRGSYQLIIVEHGNSTSARNWLIEQVDILTLFHEETLTQAQAWNIGFNAATGDNVLFLHSDVLVTENWLSYMVQSLYQDEDIAGVGPVTNFAEESNRSQCNLCQLRSCFRLLGKTADVFNNLKN